MLLREAQCSKKEHVPAKPVMPTSGEPTPGPDFSAKLSFHLYSALAHPQSQHEAPYGRPLQDGKQVGPTEQAAWRAA